MIYPFLNSFGGGTKYGLLLTGEKERGDGYRRD